MDNKFTQRQKNILNTLIKSDDNISSKLLSQEIGCSTKTIQGEIKNINSLLHGVEILSIRGIGYKITGDISIVRDIKTEKNYDDIYRINNSIKTMLKLSKDKNNTIKLEDLADDMYVSLSTIKNDFKKVKDIFKKYNLKISSKHKQGIFLDGDEEEIRKCILSICVDSSNEFILEYFLSDCVKSNLYNIKKSFLEKLEEENIILTDVEFNNYLNYIILSLSREDETNYKKYIKEYIEKQKNKVSSDNHTNIKEKIMEAIDEFTNNLKIATSIDLTEDNIFKEYLCKHIDSIYKKNSLGINQYNLMTNDIKNKYTFAFELAKIAKKTLEDKLDVEINEGEIANIAVHVGGALERNSYNKNKKVLRAIIVCTSGVGTSMLIKAKLELKFSGKLEIVKVIPSYLVEYISVLDVDFVISTVPIELKNIPVIHISPFLNETENKIIEKYIESGELCYKVSLENLFDKNIFFVDIDSNDKHEIIEYMGQELINQGYIDEEMKNSFHEREKIATTEIGNMVSIPHGANGIIYKDCIAVGILKKSIHWEISDVRLVIMLALNKERILDYENLFSEVYKRVDSIFKVISICESKNYDKFISMFKLR